MKKRVTVLLAGGLVLASLLYYVISYHARQNLDIEITEPHYYENIEAPNQLIYTNSVSGRGSWNGMFNSVGSNMGRNFNVYYRNSHPDQVRMRLQVRTASGWSNVGSTFNVPGRSEVTVTRRATPNAEHRLLIENLTGGNVSGEVRVRQL